MLLFAPLFLHGQIGINTTSPEGILDIDSSTEGILIPRVALTDLKIEAPVLNPNGGDLENSTLVYNTQTINSVSPGYYYWETDQWVRIGSNISYLSFATISLPSQSGSNSNSDFELDGDNYNKNMFRILHDGAELDGIKNGIHGKKINLYNGDDSEDLKLVSNSSSSSISKNRFSILGDVILKPGSAITIVYDGLYLQKWIVFRSDN